MINHIDIKDNFNKNKNYIIDILINYYGNEYSEVIKKRLDNVLFDFSSTPEQNYIFLKTHRNEIDELSKLLIKLRYIQFKKTQKESRKINLKALSEYIENEFPMDNLDKNTVESKTFLSLFTDNIFNSGYIDAFSSKSISLLNDPSIPEHIKESIRQDQKEFRRVIDSLGIKLEDLSTNKVDELLEYRKKLQNNYKSRITQKSKYGKNMFKEIREKFGVKLIPEELSDIVFIENAWAGYISSESRDSIAYHQMIKIPLFNLINRGFKNMDSCIIHELIHKVETNKNYVGISIHDDNNTNNLINEVRTENLAIKITKELHELGIYMYERPNNRIGGESTYEILFPLIKPFLDEHEKIFSNCAINNTPQKLYEYFGDSWGEFSKKVESVYYDNMHVFSRTHNAHYINKNDSITELINNMNSFEKDSVKKYLKN